jgi:molybdopterin converting factor small subunit
MRSATLGTGNEHRCYEAWLKGKSVALVRYWAGARAAAGVTEESLPGSTLGEVLDAARSSRDQAFAKVLSMCSFVVDEQPVGRAYATDTALLEDSVVEVLPPFAGGSRRSDQQSAGGSGG